MGDSRGDGGSLLNKHGISVLQDTEVSQQGVHQQGVHMLLLNQVFTHDEDSQLYEMCF